MQIVLRVSSDGGHNWGPLSIVAGQAGDVVGNPAPVVLNSTSVLLLYCNNNHRVLTKLLDVSSMMWGAERDIAAMVVDPKWDFSGSQSVGTGPPGGIALSNGRRPTNMNACTHTNMLPFWQGAGGRLAHRPQARAKPRAAGPRGHNSVTCAVQRR